MSRSRRMLDLVQHHVPAQKILAKSEITASGVPTRSSQKKKSKSKFTFNLSLTAKLYRKRILLWSYIEILSKLQ